MKSTIQTIANDIIGSSSLLPIPIESIAKSLGLKVLPYDLGAEISGVLIHENGEATIGYNQNESRVRKRFTIAHELGHFLLHKGENDLFVDKHYKVMFRKNNKDNQFEKQEIEANEFAACILMPETLVKKEIEKMDLNFIDFTDESTLKKLAKAFDVSSVAMSFRLLKLNLFK